MSRNSDDIHPQPDSGTQPTRPPMLDRTDYEIRSKESTINQNQRYFARGNGTAGNGGAQNRAGNTNAGQKGHGDELLKPHHVMVMVPSFEEELELAEATRNKLHVKMNCSIHDIITQARDDGLAT
ncbi:hypothetical protein Tco_1249815 [Tanacetum coccineum]